MMKTKKENIKKDWFTGVMIAQSVVSFLLVTAMLFSAYKNGEFISLMCNEYAKLMTDDITAEELEDALSMIIEKTTEQPAESKADDDSINEPESVPERIGGGEDLQFTSLDTLEGICFDEYDIDFSVSLPLKEYEVTSAYGYRISPITGQAGIHTGIDLATDYGEKIFAVSDGIVVDAAFDNSYGNYVKILHSGNITTIYAHCSELCVESGDEVEQGDVIAKVGSTGASTGNHLHFEIRKDNIRINPVYAFPELCS